MQLFTLLCLFKGIVLETYGNGNIPIKRKEIYDEIEKAVKNNILIVNVTQCINGNVQEKAIYETGLVSNIVNALYF